ncbi:hypothetical protein A3716_33390 [Alcanivorax sp. HI0011]|nr:hypothetical protein A3716_33390 [Alcanivorax sp. HI0011]
MTDKQVDDLNIASQEVLITPNALKAELPLSDNARQTVIEGRETIRNILDRKDHRLFVVIGPCSIHDTKAAMEYAQKLPVALPRAAVACRVPMATRCSRYWRSSARTPPKRTWARLPPSTV